mmetsp:Transcript_19481/g.42351  ORF Transcript_19481/g.42351 Transcript_19481/m.42351 type:complete len:210 (-) Transcript_19481:186-815(-)
MKRSMAILLLGASAASGFAPTPLQQTPPSSSLSMAKRGKGLSVSGGNNKLNKPQSISSGGSETSSAPKAAAANNWQQTSIPSIKSLPKEKNSVQLVDTNVFALKNKQTNPTGAVSIVNHEDKTYCFSSSCASCKIPLAKAKVLDGNEETGDDARVECDFCGATYNMRTGAPVAKEGGKLFGFLFSKSESVPLPVYGLGEQKGKVFINIP